MQKKIFGMIVLALLAFSVALPTVMAQEVSPSPIAPESTFLWTFIAWLIYAILGLIPSLTSGEDFSNLKLARSFVIMLLTGFFALLLHIAPVSVTTQFGGTIDSLATGIMNTGPGLTLIYGFDKLAKFLVTAKTKIQAAAPGPPTTSPSKV